MSRENDMIKLVDGILPKGPGRLSRTMESDAELIQLDREKKLLFTIDTFSDEDYFNTAHPYVLGWNAAVGGVSDILASGGRPKFFGHSMVIGRDWSKSFVQRFALGVADVLKACGAEFIGGDFGISMHWSYTATVIGAPSDYPLTRSGAGAEHGIYISGRIGAGNLGAALKIVAGRKGMGPLVRAMAPKFKLRIEEAELIRPFASTCIDTSDGVLNALNTLADLNGCGYVIDNLPFQKLGTTAARLLSLSPLLLFTGECGEYELLFTIPPRREPQFVKAARQKGLRFFRLGHMSCDKRILIRGDKPHNLENWNIRARDFDEPRAYIRSMNDSIIKAGLLD